MAVQQSLDERAKAMSPAFVLDRITAVPKLIGDPKDILFVAGLAGTAKDIAAICGDMPNYYAMAGTMGAAVSVGIGLALAQPKKRVIVATGDGELLMNVGALATAAIMNPPNLSILCVDNGHYGETGYQKSHTSLGVDLEKMAIGAGIMSTRTVSEEGEIESAGKLLRESNGVSFVLLRVAPTDGPKFKRSLDGGLAMRRFIDGLQGASA
ncbi:thiamine pyrophosphate-dependent acetolactate synthase large subunit-like protein [Constrictibacter sp. MBR-5]|jgi:phosphonopyruvate decarboxylase|uniref:thiamine pyrophosphate-dependent enzyme n=1 Tax=Constrictibacter sp. MBR-5 TaxID=3156467 RepID=UPI0033985D5B